MAVKPDSQIALLRPRAKLAYEKGEDFIVVTEAEYERAWDEIVALGEVPWVDKKDRLLVYDLGLEVEE